MPLRVNNSSDIFPGYSSDIFHVLQSDGSRNGREVNEKSGDGNRISYEARNTDERRLPVAPLYAYTVKPIYIHSRFHKAAY